MALIITVLVFATVVVGSVVLVVRTALRARITDDGDIPDPLDDYVRVARNSFTDTRDGFSRVVHGHRPPHEDSAAHPTR